jgi:hypothetical protein
METNHFSVCSTPSVGLISRQPFVWEIQVRREVLEDETARLRDVPYSLWLDVLRHPISKVVTAHDSKDYLLRVTARVIQDGSEDIEVTLSIARDSLIHRAAMRHTFTITRDNTFR